MVVVATKFKSSLFELQANEEVLVDGCWILKIVTVGKPNLKVTIDLNDRNGATPLLFNSNTEDWYEIDEVSAVVGIGDLILLGDIQVMLTKVSHSNGSARFSLRPTNAESAQLVSNAKKAKGRS
jgi:hypothetical protein